MTANDESAPVVIEAPDPPDEDPPTIADRATFKGKDGAEWCLRCYLLGDSKRTTHQHGKLEMTFEEAQRIRKVLGED